MRVLHVFKDYFPPTHGGVEHLIHDITHRMEGIEFTVLTSSRSRRLVEESDDGVLVVRAPEFGRVGSAPIAPGLAGHMKRLAPDLVHFHMPNPTAELSYLAARLDVPAVATYHAEVARARWLVPPYHLLQRRFLGRVRAVIVGSVALAAHTPVLRAVRDKVAVVPFGIDATQWADRPPGADVIRARHAGPLVLFAGRVVHYKGVHDLLEAMRLLDGTLVVVGGGDEIPALRETVERTGLDERVVFTGPVNNAERAAYYHAADVLVLPSTSRSEGFGLVLLEAMACRTPVISTEVGSGTSWVNLDGQTGFVVPPSDPRALAAAIRTILSDPQRAAAMGEAGRTRVLERFTQSRMIDGLRDVYGSALSGVRAPDRVRASHVITRFIVGGAQEHALRTVSHLPKDRYDAWIITGPETGAEGSLHMRAADDGASLDVLPQLVRDPSPIKDLVALGRLRRIFRRERPDIVHTHSSKAGIIARLAARSARVPVIVHTVHGWSFHQRMSRAERLVYKRMERVVGRFTNAIIVLSEEDRVKGLREGIGSPEQYERIPSGIDVDAFVRKEGSRRLRDSLGIPDGSQIVGSVMRLAPQKDPMTMLAAFEKAGAAATDAHFVIIGDGPMREVFDAAASASGIANRLHITGVRNDVEDLVGELTVFVLTSLWEGLPLAIIEAMAASVPIVASRVDGVAEAMTDGVEGFLVEPKDSSAFADRIVTLLGDVELRRRIGDAARARSAFYDIESMIRRHDELYRRLLNQHAGGFGGAQPEGREPPRDTR